MVTATAVHDLIAIEKLREQELKEARTSAPCCLHTLFTNSMP
jgi:hypothetical protein